MHYFILGVLLLVLAALAVRAFVNANPKTLARTLRNLGGAAALLVALFFAFTGRFAFAIPIGLAGLSLLGRNIAGLGGYGPFGGSASKSTGQTSRVRTRTLEMELDHDTGEMEGQVLQGRFASRSLSSMDRKELLALWRECRAADGQAAQLLEAYLDRRFPDWRDAAGAKTGRGQESSGASQGPMTTEEAYEILGLEPGASKADVRRAHRDLMKKLHPDRGGSTYLAAKINEAKELLLGRRG